MFKRDNPTCVKLVKQTFHVNLVKLVGEFPLLSLLGENFAVLFWMEDRKEVGQNSLYSLSCMVQHCRIDHPQSCPFERIFLL